MADIAGYLNNIKNATRGEDVRDSIISALKKINEDNPLVAASGTFKANGRYTAESGKAYTEVNVQVPDGTSVNLSLTDKLITQNGTYDPDEGYAFRTITVDVPQIGMNIMTDPKVIYRENQDDIYYAENDGYDGYSAVQIVTGGGSGGGGTTYTVSFYAADGTTLIEAKTGVPFGGGAVCTKPLPTSPGMRFVGWNPNPINVKADMNCYPRFEDMTAWDPTLITDDWVKIAQNCQENIDSYNIGQWKMLDLNAYSNPEGTETCPACTVKMILVAKGVDKMEGEDGYANTTWMIANDTPVMPYSWGTPVGAEGDNVGWNISDMRALLQGNFTTQAFPQQLIQYVKRVVKLTNIKMGANIYTDYPIVDWFFVPSIMEVAGGATDYVSAVVDSEGGATKEHNGPAYTSAFGSGDTFANLQSRRATPVGGYKLRDAYAWFGPMVKEVYPDGSIGGETSPSLIKLCFCI